MSGGGDAGLVEGHMELARFLARRMWRRVGGRVELDDLVSVAYVGLVKAAASFRPDAGAQFRTWAWRRIGGEMVDYLRAQDPLKRGHRKEAGGLQATCQFDDEDAEEPGGRLSDVPSRFASPLEAAERREAAELLARYPTRKPRDRRILAAYYLEGAGQRDVAARFGCTESRVSQVVKAELAKVRRHIGAEEAV
jgi:RNA polymerase sigma factor (sigma-70 family)